MDLDPKQLVALQQKAKAIQHNAHTHSFICGGFEEEFFFFDKLY